MAMNVGAGEGESYSDINMTPLIDIMLVLLIIFIITIPVMTHAVKIDNPLPPPPNFVPPPPPEIVNLSIDFDGTLLWNGAAVDRKTLQSYIASGGYQDRRSPRCTSRSISSPSTKRWRRPWRICRAAA
jgi:biopolymer transport protein ExbD